MSGTSLDGVDGAIAKFDDQACRVTHSHFLAYPQDLRTALLALHHSSDNELERSALLANRLTRLYADTVNQLLSKASLEKTEIAAIGCHGQTVRHQPELGFTLQIGNPALLAELTGIPVVADFRSRDIAAGGQGAPLVPAFHHAVWGDPLTNRVIINIGGIANLTYLPAGLETKGFDSGPGNMLMDAWTWKHLGKIYDENGSWALSGKVIPSLLDALLAHPYFRRVPPKSTGRDLFNLDWLQQYLKPRFSAQDVQRSLLELTAHSITNAIRDFCGNVQEIYLCGGGAYNQALTQRLQQMLHPVKIGLTDDLGIEANRVEAAAFAWLARQTLLQAPGNLPDVTGARGPRVLGAIYPA